MHYISVADGLCNGDGCLAFTEKGLRDGLLSYDDHHLTDEGSLYVTSQILIPQLAQWIPSLGK